jgi:hypothetical protein
MMSEKIKKFTVRFFSYATIAIGGIGGATVHVGFMLPAVLGTAGMWITTLCRVLDEREGE